MYRVKTMEYLYTAKQYNSSGEEEAPRSLIEDLEKFLCELDKFIKRNNYEDDLFMKNLQEDVKLCLKSLESVFRPAMRSGYPGLIYLLFHQCCTFVSKNLLPI